VGGQAVTPVDADMIHAAVADIWARVGIKPETERHGPVLLAPFMESLELVHTAIPKLTRSAVYDFLQAKGIVPADVGEIDQELAGCLFVTPSVGLVFVNSSDPVPRQRFSAAHELGHFVLHRDKMGGRVTKADTPEDIELSDEQSDQHEREANRFAVELLMPAD